MYVCRNTYLCWFLCWKPTVKVLKTTDQPVFRLWSSGEKELLPFLVNYSWKRRSSDESFCKWPQPASQRNENEQSFCIKNIMTTLELLLLPHYRCDCSFLKSVYWNKPLIYCKISKKRGNESWRALFLRQRYSQILKEEHDQKSEFMRP